MSNEANNSTIKQEKSSQSKDKNKEEKQDEHPNEIEKELFCRMNKVKSLINQLETETIQTNILDKLMKNCQKLCGQCALVMDDMIISKDSKTTMICLECMRGIPENSFNNEWAMCWECYRKTCTTYKK